LAGSPSSSSAAKCGAGIGSHQKLKVAVQAYADEHDFQIVKTYDIGQYRMREFQLLLVQSAPVRPGLTPIPVEALQMVGLSESLVWIPMGGSPVSRSITRPAMIPARFDPLALPALAYGAK
jgi:hypothetical protein